MMEELRRKARAAGVLSPDLLDKNELEMALAYAEKRPGAEGQKLVCYYAPLDLLGLSVFDLQRKAEYFGFKNVKYIRNIELLQNIFKTKFYTKFMFAECKIALRTYDQEPFIMYNTERSIQFKWVNPAEFELNDIQYKNC